MARQLVIEVKPGQPLRLPGMVAGRKGLRLVESAEEEIDHPAKLRVLVGDRAAATWAKAPPDLGRRAVARRFDLALEADGSRCRPNEGHDRRPGRLAAVLAMAVRGPIRPLAEPEADRAAEAATGHQSRSHLGHGAQGRVWPSPRTRYL